MEKATKHKNFKRIAEARTEKVLDMLDLIGNLSNTSFYEYDEKEVKAIFDAIQKSVEENKKKFNKKKSKKTSRRFNL
jgi:hypothetical protein